MILAQRGASEVGLEFGPALSEELFEAAARLDAHPQRPAGERGVDAQPGVLRGGVPERPSAYCTITVPV